MRPPDYDATRHRIQSVMRVKAFNPAPNPDLIEEVGSALGVSFPEWLKLVYRCCNGFKGPTGVGYLYRLDGHNGVLDFTRFLHDQFGFDWLQRAIIFSDNGIGGSCTVHWGALDGKLIEWCYGDGAEFTFPEGGLFDVWKREQTRWDAVWGDDP